MRLFWDCSDYLDGLAEVVLDVDTDAEGVVLDDDGWPVVDIAAPPGCGRALSAAEVSAVLEDVRARSGRLERLVALAERREEERIRVDRAIEAREERRRG